MNYSNKKIDNFTKDTGYLLNNRNFTNFVKFLIKQYFYKTAEILWMQHKP